MFTCRTLVLSFNLLISWSRESLLFLDVSLLVCSRMSTWGNSSSNFPILHSEYIFLPMASRKYLKTKRNYIVRNLTHQTQSSSQQQIILSIQVKHQTTLSIQVKHQRTWVIWNNQKWTSWSAWNNASPIQGSTWKLQLSHTSISQTGACSRRQNTFYITFSLPHYTSQSHCISDHHAQ